jgi:hypothetical protein
VTEDGGGWYPDPDGQPGRERWWDGAGWTDRTRRPDDELAGYRGRPPWQRSRGLVLLATLAVTVLALVGVVVLTRGGNPSGTPDAALSTTDGPPEQPEPSASPLSCPTAPATFIPPAATPPPPASRGARVSDAGSGISYAGQGEPWLPWKDIWVTPQLNARFTTGYFQVTERSTPGGEYYATVLSGTVSTRVADAPQEETRCIAEHLAEDVRGAYYPDPNLRRTIEAHPVSVDGRAGYLIRYHLSFDVKGYAAKGEQVGVLVLNVGRPSLAALYVSIPDTVRAFDYVIDQVFASVHTL